MFGFVTFFTLTSVSFIILGSIDTVMLGALVNDTVPIGLYRSAFALISSIAGFFGITQVLLPLFIKMDKKRLQDAFNKTFRYIMSLAIPAALGIAVLGNYFLFFVYGKEYLEATLPLVVLSFIIILGVQSNLFVNLFLTKEKPKDYLGLLVFVIILNIILNYLLIKFFLNYSVNLAATGVAIATILSWLIYTIGLNFLVKKKLNIKVNFGVMIKPIIAGIIMVLVIYYLKNWFADINLFNGIILVGFGILVYASIMFIIRGFVKEDLSLIKILMKR